MNTFIIVEADQVIIENTMIKKKDNIFQPAAENCCIGCITKIEL